MSRILLSRICSTCYSSNTYIPVDVQCTTTVNSLTPGDCSSECWGNDGSKKSGEEDGDEDANGQPAEQPSVRPVLFLGQEVAGIRVVEAFAASGGEGVSVGLLAVVVAGVWLGGQWLGKNSSVLGVLGPVVPVLATVRRHKA